MSEYLDKMTRDLRQVFVDAVSRDRWAIFEGVADTGGAVFDYWLDQVRREARTVTQEQIATMSRAVAVHAAGNLPGLPDDEFECCFRAALHEAGFIIEQEGKSNE